MKYSIWITPQGEIQSKLSEIITDLSKKYDAPDFEPHMTLLGDIDLDEETVLEKTEQLVSELKKFPLTLREISFSTTYFQSVFVRVKSTSVLMNANLKAKEIFEYDNSVFMPHISLIYGEHDMVLREKIAAEIKLSENLSFTAEKLVIVPSTLNPDDWRPIADFSLH